MLVGGGTGGHILPLLAVAHELKKNAPKIHIIAVIDDCTNFGHLVESSKQIDEVKQIKAGKFRRYPNQSIIDTLIDLKTTLLNIRDFFRMITGVFQSLTIIIKQKPALVFIKGGFVGVPVGIGCRLTNTPFITHDSDATPGLANRIIGRWAHTHTVAMNKKLYNYSSDRTIQVGVPISSNFQKITPTLKKQYRKSIGIPDRAKLIFITGGSLGAQELNNIIASISHSLIANPNVYVIHQTGKWSSNDLPIDTPRYIAVEYLSDIHKYSGSADIIITRAGSVIAEFAVQHKAIIVVPAPQLADGHQIKNAKIIKNEKAGIVISQDELKQDPTKILSAVDELLNDNAKSKDLANNLNKLYPSGATVAIAKIILKLTEAGE